MAERNREEKQFSEDLDRLLAGEETGHAEEESDDYRTTVEFARKIISHRDSLSLHSKEQLRSRLLSRLAEHESRAAPTRQPWWSQLMGNPVWRTATVTVAVAVLAFLVIWQSGMLGLPQGELAQRAPAPSSAPSVAPAPATAPTPAQAPAALSSEKAAAPALDLRQAGTLSAALGEEVRVQFEFTNRSSQAIDLSGFPPAFRVAPSGTEQAVRSFPAGGTRRVIAASETIRYVLVWDQKDDRGNQVGPGTYSVLVDDVLFRAGGTADESRQAFGPVAEIVIQAR